MSSWIFSLSSSICLSISRQAFPCHQNVTLWHNYRHSPQKTSIPVYPSINHSHWFCWENRNWKAINQPIIPVGSFWLMGATYLPLRKMMEWVRQLGPDDIPNWMESLKIPWFQSPPTRSFINYIPMFVLSHFQMLVNSHEITNQLMVISIIIPFDIPIIPIYSQKLFPLYHKSILFFPSTYNDYS